MIRSIINYILLLTLFTFIAGCATASSSQRYNQSKPKSEEQVKKKSIRFTSADSVNYRNYEPEITFPEIPDSLLSEFDEIPVEVEPVDKSKFVGNVEKLKSFNVPLTHRERILFEVIKYLDTPYKYGGNTENGIDCSAFTKFVYQNAVNLELPRSTREQFKVGENISKYDLQFGDLVYFNTTKRSYPGHVGIYLGDDQFVHASRSLGVTVSSLEDPYYKKRFIGARRLEKID